MSLSNRMFVCLFSSFKKIPLILGRTCWVAASFSPCPRPLRNNLTFCYRHRPPAIPYSGKEKKEKKKKKGVTCCLLLNRPNSLVKNRFLLHFRKQQLIVLLSPRTNRAFSRKHVDLPLNYLDRFVNKTRVWSILMIFLFRFCTHCSLYHVNITYITYSLFFHFIFYHMFNIWIKFVICKKWPAAEFKLLTN